MGEDLWSKVDSYIDGKLLAGDPALQWVLQASDEAGLMPIAVSPSQGKFLNLLVKLRGAERVLEIGTLGGYSAIWMALGLPKDGKLVALEIDPKAVDVARANFKKAGVDPVAELRSGPALASLQELVKEKAGPFDLIFIDADKPSYPDYLAWSLKLSRVGTVILLDNMVRKGEIVTSPEGDARVVGARKTYDMIAREPRLSATALQTVGVKGHDGFVMALVVA
ncbi:MAG TPA: O-methyltransferase [bacterium]|nr:O-methyltransferase [bacterium]